MLKHILLAAAVAVGPMAVAGCSNEPARTRNDRWATTENTNVEIDWDQVNEAYKQANGPEDFERRVNEIYGGHEVISVAVRDDGARAQVVTGFFDRNKSGSVDEGEKVFTITRELTGEGQAQVQTTGYGPYAYYHSPVLSIVSGMMLGSMLSSAFSPHYVPVYHATPYTTSAARVGHLHSERASYRAANPSRFGGGKPSMSGRSYGTPSKSWGRSGGSRSGGGRFGLAARGDGPRRRLAS